MVGAGMPTDVDDVELATGTQDAVNLRQRTSLHVFVQVVQHHRRECSIEFAVRERKLLRISTLEANPGQPPGFSLRTGERQRVRIGADDV